MPSTRSRRPTARRVGGRRQARFTSARQRSRGQLVHLLASQANGAVTAGTARQVDLVAAMETAFGSDLGGCLIARGNLRWTGRPTVTGASAMTMALYRGIDTLDVGDLLPATDALTNYLRTHTIATYGQRHLVATTPTLEFEEFRRTLRHGPVRLRAVNDTLWSVEECVNQNWEAQWVYESWVDVS